VRRHVPGHHAARTNQGIFTNRDAAEQRGSGTDGSAPLDECRDAGPIRLDLQLSISIRGAGISVVGECDVVADEDIVLQNHSLTEKTVTGDLTTIADPDPFLNLDKRADFHVIPDFATVKIGVTEKTDVPT